MCFITGINSSAGYPDHISITLSASYNDKYVSKDTLAPPPDVMGGASRGDGERQLHIMPCLSAALHSSCMKYVSALLMSFYACAHSELFTYS